MLSSGPATLVGDDWTRPTQADHDAAYATYSKKALAEQRVRAFEVRSLADHRPMGRLVNVVLLGSVAC